MTCAILALAALTQAPDEDGFTSIFDGKTLDGWVSVGGGKYRVEGGTILGETGTGAYGWLCTRKKYGDFELRLEARAEHPGNSGVQVRSRVDEKGVMIGYQFDFDRTRPSSGRLYDEARRKLLMDVPLDPKCRNALKPGDWNRFRIRCVGDHLRSWINGIRIVDYRDSVDLEGIIALQVHSGTKKHVRMRWRNLRIKDLGRHRWKSIDLSDGPSGDVTVRMKFRVGDGVAGLLVAGKEVRLSPRAELGAVYDAKSGRRLAEPAKKAPETEWTSLTVSAHGKWIAVHANDVLLTNLKEAPAGEGRLELRPHAGAKVEAKDAAILTPKPK